MSSSPLQVQNDDLVRQLFCFTLGEETDLNNFTCHIQIPVPPSPPITYMTMNIDETTRTQLQNRLDVDVDEIVSRAVRNILRLGMNMQAAVIFHHSYGRFPNRDELSALAAAAASSMVVNSHLDLSILPSTPLSADFLASFKDWVDSDS
jgi:hypothetical protein